MTLPAPFRSKYFSRTFASFSLIIIFSTSLTLIGNLNRTTSKSLHVLESSMYVAVNMLGDSVVQHMERIGSGSLQSHIKDLSALLSLRITVISKTGDVLADSDQDPLTMDNHLRRPEIQAASVTGIGATARYSTTLGREYRYLAVPLALNGEVLAYIRVAKSLSEFAAEVTEERSMLIRNSIFIALLALALGFVFFSQQANKLEHLIVVLKDFTNGKFEKRLPDAGSLGLSEISESINQIARQSEISFSRVAEDRNRLATVFTCMVEGVIDVDLEQTILHVNDAAVRLLSIESKSCVGQPIWHAIRNQTITDALDRAIKQNTVERAQVVLQRDLSTITLDVYAASLQNDYFEPMGAVLVLHDITEVTNLERIRTDFVANASHELKTPIAAIRAITETLLDDRAIDLETTQHFIKRLHAQSLRVADLIQDLMTISRLESSQGISDYSKVDLRALINRAVEVAKIPAGEKNQIIETKLTDEEFFLFADSHYLSQLLDNLLDNAVKYTQDSGLISIILECDRRWVTLKVCDNGLGMSSDQQQRIFERFYRVDKARSQSLGGTGLGLSIVKNIAEKHGGSIEVTSKIGAGSTFTLRLPTDTGAATDA